jgi:hypothetical protein
VGEGLAIVTAIPHPHPLSLWSPPPPQCPVPCPHRARWARRPQSRRGELRVLMGPAGLPPAGRGSAWPSQLHAWRATPGMARQAACALVPIALLEGGTEASPAPRRACVTRRVAGLDPGAGLPPLSPPPPAIVTAGRAVRGREPTGARRGRGPPAQRQGALPPRQGPCCTLRRRGSVPSAPGAAYTAFTLPGAPAAMARAAGARQQPCICLPCKALHDNPAIKATCSATRVLVDSLPIRDHHLCNPSTWLTAAAMVELLFLVEESRVGCKLGFIVLFFFCASQVRSAISTTMTYILRSRYFSTTIYSFKKLNCAM